MTTEYKYTRHVGTDGDDRVEAGAGDDVVYAGAGDDYVEGGRGDDTFVVDMSDEGSLEIGDFGRGDNEIMVHGLTHEEIAELVAADKAGDVEAIKAAIGGQITFSDGNVSYDDLELSSVREYGVEQLRITLER